MSVLSGVQVVRFATVALLVGSGALAAASCSSNAHPPDFGSGGGDGAADAKPVGQGDAAPSNGSDSGAAHDAAAIGDARPTDGTTDVATPDANGGDSSVSDGGASPSDAASGGEPPPPPDPVCDPAHAWVNTGRVTAIPAQNFARFGGVGSDERSVAWTTADGSVLVADRASTDDDFGTPLSVDLSATSLAADRVALGPTGLLLVAVASGRTNFVEFTRPARNTAWTMSAGVEFANVDVMAGGESMATFSEPVLGCDGTSFYFLLTGSGMAPVLFESRWDDQQHEWATGTALVDAPFLSPSPTVVRRATGAASDGRTFFFFDPSDGGSEQAAWRESVSAPFGQFGVLGLLSGAAPNLHCDALYFEGSDLNGGGVFVAR